MKKYLRRYTDIPFLLDYLHTKELVLLSPKTWDDKNDSYFLNSYAQKKGFENTYALCLTEAPETYHHWKIFTSGSSGICIEFKKEMLIDYAEKVNGLRAKSVQYSATKEFSKQQPTCDQLPFLKRKAFRDESEFRLFLASNKDEGAVRFHVPASAINSVVLSPWIPEIVAARVVTTINGIVGCKSIKVKRSQLIENEKWKNLVVDS